MKQRHHAKQGARLEVNIEGKGRRPFNVSDRWSTIRYYFWPALWKAGRQNIDRRLTDIGSRILLMLSQAIVI